jgi:hypothetical protein
MNIYLYSEETKEFLIEKKAKISPLDNSYLIPKNATDILPLEPKEGYAVCFINNNWQYVIDNRNSVYYLNNKKVEFKLGDIITPEMKTVCYTDKELFDKEIKQLRLIRNILLSETDYLILQDSTLTPAKRSEWMTYRTALRNLTEGLDTVEKINNVVYPLKPQI